MKQLKWTAFALCLLLLASCSSVVSKALLGCPDAEIDYVDAIKWNDITYQHHYDHNPPALQTGTQLGTTSYKLSGHACSDYVMRHSDATVLPVGTAVYEVQGYKPSFRIAAAGKLYEASSNPAAQTLADFYDMTGKTSGVSLHSSEDDRFIADLSEEAADQFIHHFLALPYLGRDAVYSASKLSGERIFLRIHLQDGTFVREVYWPEDKAFYSGAYATDALHQLIMEEFKP